MLHYYKFRQELFAPAPAKEVYIKRRGGGRGWPEQCPPVRAANAFGFDLLANFDVTFIQSRGSWRANPDIVIDSDFEYAPTRRSPGTRIAQQYAWFWQKGQRLPHVISENVYAQISNQVKISSYLFLATDEDELLLFTDIPSVSRPWKAISALVDTDWYPASYPWHVVIELDRSMKKIEIRKGDPLCRVIPVRRDRYFACEMPQKSFDRFFERGQKWLRAHGRFEHEGAMDITGSYAKQQVASEFCVR